MSTWSIIAKSDPTLFRQLLEERGLSIVGRQDRNPLHKTVQPETITALASTLDEDVDCDRELLKLAELAHRHGYIVAFSEGLNQMPGTEVDPIISQLRHPTAEEPEPAPEEEEGGDEAGGPALPQ